MTDRNTRKTRVTAAKLYRAIDSIYAVLRADNFCEVSESHGVIQDLHRAIDALNGLVGAVLEVEP